MLKITVAPPITKEIKFEKRLAVEAVQQGCHGDDEFGPYFAIQVTTPEGATYSIAEFALDPVIYPNVNTNYKSYIFSDDCRAAGILPPKVQ